MYQFFIIIFLLLLLLVGLIGNKKIKMAVWSINVFNSKAFISKTPYDQLFKKPTLQASDVTDISAQFVADPFLILHNSKFFLFFEILDVSLGRGVIGLATSMYGEEWKYEKVVLKEDFHLSFPYVFKSNNDFYLIPESNESNGVFLYKAKNFPYEWEVSRKLISGKHVDASIFEYANKWWMFTGKNGELHLFYSENLEGDWIEHPKSPIDTKSNIFRPAGRVIVDKDVVYRYSQETEPYYGKAVHLIKIKNLSEIEYEEEEVGVVLEGSKTENDWRKDGMHSIDQLRVSEEKWMIAVDGHNFEEYNYVLWKIKNILSKHGGLKKRFPNITNFFSGDVNKNH